MITGKSLTTIPKKKNLNDVGLGKIEILMQLNLHCSLNELRAIAQNALGFKK